MNIQLAHPINSYFDISNGIDPTGLKECFTPDAVVLDEGGTHQGLPAITTWFLDTRKKYNFQAKPLSVARNDTHEIVVAEVSGNFPGSPIQLSYAFLLHEGKIQSMEIS